MIVWTADPRLDADAEPLRWQLVQQLAASGELPAEWARAMSTVPRHRFVPGFYLPCEQSAANGLTIWEPVTAATDPARWLAAARHRQLLELLAGGHTNAQIARKLGLSEGTVRTHLENLYRRLRVSSRTAAVARAFPARDSCLPVTVSRGCGTGPVAD